MNERVGSTSPDGRGCHNGGRLFTSLQLLGMIIVFLWVVSGPALGAATSASLDLSLDLGLSVARLEAGATPQRLSLPSLASRLEPPAWTSAPSPTVATVTASSNTVFPDPDTVPRLINPSAKMDPMLRTLWKRYKSQGVDLTGFVNALSLYAPHGSVSHPPAMQELGAFTPRPVRSNGYAARNADRLGVLITLDGPSAPLRSMGVDLGLDPYGDVVTARVSLEELDAISRLPEVAYIEASYMLAPTLDQSVPDVQGDVVHTEAPAAAGAGVFLGHVDTGIDWTHLDFRVDRNQDGIEEGSRIAFLWDQTEQEPLGSRAFVPFGSEYTREDIEADLLSGDGFDSGRVRERDANGHGTHVAGIQGGDGSSSDAGFVGMAPQATLGAVRTTFASGDIIDGVTYLFDRGDSLGMSTVVNLSLGGHFGPHDGTSAFERALDSLVGPGHIVVNSAGNEGNDNIHVSDDLNGDSFTVDFTSAGELGLLTFWYEGAADFSVELITPDGTEAYEIHKGELIETSWQGRVITIDNASQGPYPFNGDNNLFLIMENIEKGSVWTITLQHQGGPGHFDGWVGLGSLGELSVADPSLTISEPGNAKKVITVGAYTSKERWESIAGRKFGFVGANPVGEIAAFSSIGPTRDGRQKPDLTAPGTAIVSTLAAGSGLSEVIPLTAPDGVHAALQGTSMASPHVSGAIALMLQAEPFLDAQQILSRLRGTAGGDDFTGQLPNVVWGFGKLDSLLGLDSIGLELPLIGERVSLKVGLNAAQQQAYFFYVLPLETEEAELQVFNALGQRVRTVELDPAQNRHEWNLLDDQGQPLPNGIYLCIAMADGQRSKVQPMVIANG